MVSTDLIETVLEQQWPDECEIAGKATTHNIAIIAASGNSLEENFRTAEGGANWDSTETIKFLVEAATLVKLSLEIWGILSERLERKPTEAEFAEEVKSDRWGVKFSAEVLGSINSIFLIISGISL